MEIEKFVAKFAEQFEDTPADTFSAETTFRDIEEWDSLIALSIIAMADDEYGVQLTGDDIRASNTVADIFEKVKAKKEA
jgi:acyl carrier protein